MSDNDWLNDDQKQPPETTYPTRSSDPPQATPAPLNKQQGNDNEQSWVVQNPNQQKQGRGNVRSRSTVQVQKNISAIDQISGEQLIPDNKNDTSHWGQQHQKDKQEVKNQDHSNKKRGNRGNRDSRQGQEETTHRGNRRTQPQQQNARAGRGNRASRDQSYTHVNANRLRGFQHQTRNHHDGFRGNRDYHHNPNREHNHNNRDYNTGGNERGRGRGRGRGGFHGYGNDQRQNGQERNFNGNNRFNHGDLNSKTEENSQKKQAETVATSEKLVKKRICWPQTSLHICRLQIRITLRKIDDIPSKLLLIPYKTNRFEYYPGNIVNQSPARYKDMIRQEEEKGKLEAGHIIIKKAMNVARFEAIAFLRIQEDKMEQSFEKGFANFFKFSKFFKDKGFTSVVFCTSKELGEENIILKHIFNQIQANEKSQEITQLFVNTNHFETFTSCSQAFTQQLRKLYDNNDLSVE